MSSPARALLQQEFDPHAADSSLRYMPGLDVVRGTAILMVLFAHGLGENGYLYWGVKSQLLLLLRAVLFSGVYGVHIFFVLSGFLITGILLDSRARTDFYRRFYVRRVLRIVPAYLVLLIVLKSGHWISSRFLIASLLYLSNMPRLFGATTDYGGLWSLSVEEQFYLIWPTLVRKLNRTVFVRLCIAIVVLSPLLRFGLQYLPGGFSDIGYKTWDVMDFFAAGALLACGVRSSVWRGRLDKLCVGLTWAGLALIVVTLILAPITHPTTNKLGGALIVEPWLILATGFVGLGALRPSMSSVAVARPLTFLANISYGLYLCHQAVFMLVDKHWHWWLQDDWLKWHISVLLRFCVEAGLAILIAFISRRTLEEFFLRLKPKPPQQPHRREIT